MKEKKADTVAEHLRATSDKGVQELDNLIHQRLRRARTLTDNLMPRSGFHNTQEILMYYV